MKVYRRGSLREDIGDILKKAGLAEDGAEALKKWLDDKEANIMQGAAYIDKGLAFAEKYPVGWVALKTRLAQEAVKKGVESAVDAIWNTVEKRIAGIISIPEILNMLIGNEDDLLSLKMTAFTTGDPGRFTRPFEPEKTVYRTTTTGYSDAVYNYANPPRANGATHLAVYAPLPFGIATYIMEEVQECYEILTDPLLAGLGITDLFSMSGWANILRGLKEFALNALDKSIPKDGVSISGGSGFERKVNRVSFDGKPSADPRDDSEWRLKIALNHSVFGALARVPVNRRSRLKYAMRVRAINAKGRDVEFMDTWIEPRVVGVAAANIPYNNYRMGPAARETFREGVEPKLFILPDYIRPQSIYLDVKQNKGLGAKLDQFIQDQTVIAVELWSYSYDRETGYTLNRLEDARFMDLALKQPLADRYWVGVSIGSMFPSLEGYLDALKNFLKDLLSTMLRVGDVAIRALRDLLETLYRLFNRIVAIAAKLSRALMNILRAISYMDIRYCLFHGSYHNLPEAWRLIKTDFQLYEGIGYFFPTLVATVKGDWGEAFQRKVEDFVDKVAEATKFSEPLPVEASQTPLDLDQEEIVSPVVTILDEGYLPTQIGPPDIPEYITTVSEEDLSYGDALTSSREFRRVPPVIPTIIDIPRWRED